MAFKLFKVLGHTTAVSGLPVLVDQSLMVAKTGYDVVISDGVRNRYVSTPPIGFVYTRYPGQTDPATLFPGTTWQAQYYAGAFFRAETSGGGGPEVAFNGAMQTAQNLTHDHGSTGAGGSHLHGVGTYAMSNDSPDHTHVVPNQPTTKGGNGGNTADYRVWLGSTSTETTGGASARHSHTPSGSSGSESAHVHAVGSSGGADLRPINYTIQIYKRTA